MAATCFNWVPDTFFIVFLCWQSRKMSGMRTGCIQSPLGKSVRHLPATKQATKLVICCGFSFLSPTSCLPWCQIVLGCHWVEVRGFGLPLNCYSSLWAIGGLESRSGYACSSSELRGRLMVPSASSSASCSDGKWLHKDARSSNRSTQWRETMLVCKGAAMCDLPAEWWFVALHFQVIQLNAVEGLEHVV